MRFAVYSPYLDTFGGGEKYLLTIAEALTKLGEVDLLIDTNLAKKNPRKLKEVLADRFALDLDQVNLVNAPLGAGTNLVSRALFLKKYQLLFSFTDGSIFYASAKKNILHIQTPLANINSKNIWGKIKLNSWDLVVYNSQFTKKNSQKNWSIPGEVVYPPVDVEKIAPLEKKNYILNVGRFFGYLKIKKHELMIEVFKELIDTGELKGWELYLVGAATEGDLEYVDELKKMAKGYPVIFEVNASYEQLVKLYGESKIYWHAMGYGEDDPTKMEHFGISTVEAMSGGCVPVVINKGGQLAEKRSL